MRTPCGRHLVPMRLTNTHWDFVLWSLRNQLAPSRSGKANNSVIMAAIIEYSLQPPTRFRSDNSDFHSLSQSLLVRAKRSQNSIRAC